MNWKWIVGIGGGLIAATAVMSFVVLPKLAELPEFDPGTPRARAALPLHPKYWVGADMAPPPKAAFEKTEVAPGAQQNALLGAAAAAKVKALLASGHSCDTGKLTVYSRAGNPRQLILTECRRAVPAQEQAVEKDDYPSLLVLHGEELHELTGLEPFGFAYDSGELAGVSDLDNNGELELWLRGAIGDCDKQADADCDAQGSIIVAETAQGLQKQDYSMDASCPEIRKREDEGKANCVCGPGLAPFRELFPARHTGMELAAMCGYAEEDGSGDQPVVSGIAYYSGVAEVSGALLRERGPDGETISFADPTRQDATARLRFETKPAGIKGESATAEDPCLSAPASIGLRLLKIVTGSGSESAFAVKYALGKTGKFKPCAAAAE